MTGCEIGIVLCLSRIILLFETVRSRFHQVVDVDRPPGLRGKAARRGYGLDALRSRINLLGSAAAVPACEHSRPHPNFRAEAQRHVDFTAATVRGGWLG